MDPPPSYDTISPPSYFESTSSCTTVTPLILSFHHYSFVHPTPSNPYSLIFGPHKTSTKDAALLSKSTTYLSFHKSRLGRASQLFPNLQPGQECEIIIILKVRGCADVVANQRNWSEIRKRLIEDTETKKFQDRARLAVVVAPYLYAEKGLSLCQKLVCLVLKTWRMLMGTDVPTEKNKDEVQRG